jgi:integral membrane protein
VTASPEGTTTAASTGNARIASALLRYRVLAWITGVWLLVLTAEIIYKYVLLDDSDSAPSWFFYIGQAHGIFYMIYLAVTIDLAIKVRWKPVTTITTALAGTIPFMSFVAEHYRTQQVKRDFGI